MSTTGQMFTRKVRGESKGSRDGQRLKIAVGFAPGTFHAIAASAKAGGISFSEQVRRMCDRALEGPPFTTDDTSATRKRRGTSGQEMDRA